MNKKATVFVIFFIASFLTFSTPLSVEVRAAQAGDVIITEIMNNPAAISDTTGEWFELYNPTGDAIDLDGWIISEAGTATHTIVGPLIIASGAYLTLARSATPGFTPDYVYIPSPISLNQDADSVVITGEGTEVARVDYDSNEGWPLAAGYSLEYKELTSTNQNVASSWGPATTDLGNGDYGTPGSQNSGVPEFNHLFVVFIPFITLTFIILKYKR